MEFNFNINNYFKDEITKVGSRLIPDGFIGDRREIQDCLSKVSYILTILGEKSAKAQGLQKVITSGEKLRNSDHIVYILVDPRGGSKGYGSVLGMLKMGTKHLYMFDGAGNNHEVTTKCILDFYVHESKQRMGLGKKLFQYMLKEERVDPVHLAIDKPSSKFLSFLLKHYGLETIIPQMNNFVVFEGFFCNRPFGGESKEKEKLFPAGVTSCGNRYGSGPTRLSPTSPTSHHYQSASTININHASYYGRPPPHKPVSTMGMILQHKPSPSQQPPQNGSPKEEQDENVENVINEEEKENAEVSEEVLSVVEEPTAVQEVVPEVEETGPVEELQEKVEEISQPDTPVEPFKTPATISNEAKVRNSQGHLDLKFYHSSLW